MVFKGNTILKVLKRRQFEVQEPIVFQGQRDRFVIPAGFITDLASVPRFLWWLLPSYGSYTQAAILHDLLWRISRGEFPPAFGAPLLDPVDTDGMFRRAMSLSGTSWPVRWVMWGAVRWAAIASGFKGTMSWVTWLQLVAVTVAALIPLALVAAVVVWLVLR